MSNIRNVVVFFILILSLGLYANGNEEKGQKLSKLVIKDGSTVVDEFSIVRDASLGQELFYIVSSLEGRKYYVDLVSTSDIIGGNPLTFDISGDDIGVEIDGIFSYVSTLSSNDLDLRRLNPVHNYYKPEITQIGVRLISYDTPANSYQFILKVHPTVTINSDETVSDSVLKESLRDSIIYRRFFRKQVLGDSSYTATESNPFPIANLNNHYSYLVENNSTADETIIDRVQFETFIRPFDVIYNHDVNDNEEMGDSIIYKFLKVYFNNDKPLFHSYINDYMDDNFNYHQYDKISTAEGKELVNHALKFLTWGLEYTPDENYRAITGGDNIYPSQLLNYENNETTDYNDLTEWIRTNTFNTDNREKNYLGYEPVDITEIINVSDVTYDQDKIDELQALAGDYFTPNQKVTSGLELTTPFKVGDTVITGSALPYVQGGIDTPRTFNYKMTKQFDIVNDFLAGDYSPKSWYGTEENSSWSRNNYFFTTKSNGVHMTPEDYYFYYFDNSNREDYVDITTQSPFMPGRETEGKYRGLNLTGVDSLGLLSGALSMTSYYKRILNLSNSAPVTNMDTLNRMTTFPAFSSSPQENQDIYRLTRNDIERSSVIIPDLSQMQPGDLLVKGSSDDTDVAIVIDTGYTEGDETFYLGNVLVLSVNEEDKRVAVCYWGQNGTYSSFTNEPKNYVLRRLLKFTGTISDNDEYSFSEFTELEKTADYWDPFVFQPEPLFVHMDTSSNRNYSRWIPNTGEIYEISSIKFSPSELKPIVELEDYNNSDVIISAPSDINYDVTGTGHDSETSGNNILVNKGDGFVFYALNTFTDSTTNEDYYDTIRLATFNINTSSTNEFDRYTVEYNDDIFTSDGHCRDGFTLKYKKFEGLVFNIGTDNSFTNFGIRPLETNIRPGDDILLNFEIYDNGNSIPVHSPDREFLAVYDEKMLWRANLYIDEGGGDWNSENPWNAPPTTAEANNFGAVEDNGVIKRFLENSGTYSEMGMFKYHNSPDWVESGSERVWYGVNEWNKRMEVLNDTEEDGINVGANHFAYNTSGARRWEDLSQLTNGNGKQVVNIPSTMFYKSIENISNFPETIIENGVVYNFVRTTTPFEFYYQMRQQNHAMKAQEAIDHHTVRYISRREEVDSAKFDLDNATDETRNELRSIYRNALIALREVTSKYYNIGESTLPPDNNWLNYVMTSYVPSYKDYSKNTPGIPTYGSPLYPFQDDGSNNALEAGVDCGGIIYAAEMYEGTPYMSTSTISARTGYREIHDCNESVPAEYSTPYNYRSNNLWYISHKGNLENELDTEESLDINLIPGDIVYYSEGDSYHVMIVQDVEVDELHNDISSRSIKIIESTYGQEVEFETPLFGVGKIRTLGDPELFGKNWIIGRLKTE